MPAGRNIVSDHYCDSERQPQVLFASKCRIGRISPASLPQARRGKLHPRFGIDIANMLRVLAARRARALPQCSPSRVPRAQGRPGADWHPRSTVRRLRYKRLHSGIQVKPNIRPSLRSGLTAYVALSPGSDALLPPSPCGWLMGAPGWATRITARLGRQTSGARTTRFCRTQITPVVCATAPLTVTRPARPFAPMRPASTTSHPACRDDRDSAPRPGWDCRNMRQFRIRVKRIVFVVMR